jgi:hypothetical protein
MGVLKRTWIPLVITVVVAVGGFFAYRLHGAFASQGVSTTGQVEVIQPINVKRVTYEVTGPADAVGYVSYLDENAQPHGAQFASLPWSYTVTTTLPGVIASVVAQGNSDTIGCRIVVNGQVREQQSASRLNAQTFCLVKAA